MSERGEGDEHVFRRIKNPRPKYGKIHGRSDAGRDRQSESVVGQPKRRDRQSESAVEQPKRAIGQSEEPVGNKR